MWIQGLKTFRSGFYSLYKNQETEPCMYVKECFNDAQQSSKTNLDAVIVQQNKSRFGGIFCQNTTEMEWNLDHLVCTFHFLFSFFTLVVICMYVMIVDIFDINYILTYFLIRKTMCESWSTKYVNAWCPGTLKKGDGNVR